jgi:hypothetical protein
MDHAGDILPLAGEVIVWAIILYNEGMAWDWD